MRKGIIPSIAVKILGGLISFLLIVIYTNTLGPKGVGSIALIVLSVSMVVLANDFVGGGALIYFVPRLPIRSLLKTSYGWAILVTLLAFPLLLLLPFDWKFVTVITGIALLQCLNSIHLNIFIGSERIGAYNVFALLQFVLLASGISLCFFVWFKPHINYFMLALLTAHVVVYLSSLIPIIQMARKDDKNPEFENVFTTLIKHGGYVQSANISQLLNYRISYYLLEAMGGINARAFVGLVSTTNNLAESVWYIPKGISVVQYGKISNMTEEDEKVRYTIQIFRMVLVVTLPLVIILAVLPASFFSFVFGEAFSKISTHIYYILPGILLLAQSTTLVNYFSGKGLYRVNATGSIIGLVVTIFAGYFLIKYYMVTGALLTASLSYGATFLFMFISFIRRTNSTIFDFLPTAKDLVAWKKQIFS